MKIQNAISSSLTAINLLATILLSLGLVPAARGQLVADGATKNQTTATNLSPGNLTVGTNGGNTVLNIIAPGAVTNASGYIGFNLSSSSNKVTVQNSGALWNNDGYLYVGNSGSRNTLVVSNAGKVISSGGVLGSGSTNNQAIVTGTGSSWNMAGGELDIGGVGSGNSLLIAAGGTVTNGIGSIGFQTGADNNQVTVTDGGSVWQLSDELSVGEVGAGNTLLVTNGGVVSGATAYLGRYTAGNRLVVTGPNSALNLTSGLWPGGNTGTSNTLLVANGGRVTSAYGWIGSGGSSNQVTVTGTGSSWTNGGELIVGGSGSGNQVTVETNGTVVSGTDTILGQYSGGGNVLKLAGGTLAVGGALDVRRGTLQLDSGTATTTTLWATNGANSSIVFNGGTLITRGGTINNGLPFTLGSTNYPAATWVVFSNATPTTINADLYIGSDAPNASLLISNGATLNSSRGYLGRSANSDSNTVIVSGLNSAWNTGRLVVGTRSHGNMLLINSGATVNSTSCDIGFDVGSSANAVIVDGPNSRWNNAGPLWVGDISLGNTLQISNGGTVTNTLCNLGYVAGGNLVTVSGAGSVWNNGGLLTVGITGAGFGSGSVFVGSGALAIATGLIVGAGSATNNLVTVDGGTLRVTSAAGAATMDIRRGTNILNDGFLEVDQLLMTNVAGVCSFNGGTLSVSNSTVNNGSPFVVGNGFLAHLQLLGNGRHTFANGLTIPINGRLYGSGTVSGALTVQNGWFFPGGNGGIGRLILSNSPSLNGLLYLDVSKTGTTLTNDELQVTAPLTYSGIFGLNKFGPTPLANGDSFKLFTASSYAGAFNSFSLPILPAGLMWTNKLLVDGTLAVVPQTAPSIINVTQSGTNLIMNITGGPPGAYYELHSSTNLTQALVSWPLTRSGNLDWLGNLTITNGINLAEPQRYFRLLAIPGGGPD